MERIAINQGKEHFIFDSSRDGWILKRPKFLQVMVLNVLSKYPSEIIKEELKSVGNVFLESGIKIPKTKVFTFKGGYVMVQRKVVEDSSLNEQQKHILIVRSKHRYVYDYYVNNSDNFISNNGSLYCIDPSLGYARILKILGVVSYQTQTKIRGILFGKVKVSPWNNVNVISK